MALEPVPFTIGQPGEDTFELDGVRSVTYRLSGMLSLVVDTIVLEWTLSRHVEEVFFISVEIDDAELPPECLELPADQITAARLVGGWWAPRLVLHARWANAFDPIPGAGRGIVSLRLARRDRGAARAMADALRSAHLLAGTATPPEFSI